MGVFGFEIGTEFYLSGYGRSDIGRQLVVGIIGSEFNVVAQIGIPVKIQFSIIIPHSGE